MNKKLTSFRLSDRLYAPVDIAWLVFFRIAFGALMFAEIARYFFKNKIYALYLQPLIHFTYYGFDWVKPWPGDGLYIHFVGLAVLALFIMTGFFYRLSMFLFFLGFTYLFLLDEAYYLNHFYLILLVSFLMIFMPAERAFSFDAVRRPRVQSGTVPAWTLWLLRFQVAIPYFYGGLAKLNEDWLRGWPLKIWLPQQTQGSWVAPLFSQPWFALFMSYGGLLLDLFIVPFLLWKRTRIVAFVFALLFHLTNSGLWEIGIFPWFMVPATLLFFEPPWPRGLLKKLGWKAPAPPAGASAAAMPLRGKKQRLELLLTLFVVWQLFFPFRYLLYPGYVNWTKQGYRFSWRMMLFDKRFSCRFWATDPESGRQWAVDPNQLLTKTQLSRMVEQPDMILQFAHEVARRTQELKGYKEVQVRTDTMVSFNGRYPQYLVDPTVDLASRPRTLAPKEWVLPLTQPPREFWGASDQ